MDFRRKDWNSQDKIPRSLIDKTNFSATSSSRLADFKYKLDSKIRSPKNHSIPTWKSFRNEIRHKVSPPRLTSPRFDQYSSIQNFRTLSSPRNASPIWRYKVNSESRTRSFSRPESPKPFISPNKLSSKTQLPEIIKNSDIRLALEALSEMNDQEIRAMPLSYIGDLNRLCTQVTHRLRNSGFEFS